MNTTVTSKGQVTLSKEIRDATGIQPGDEVVVRATTGGVYIQKAGAESAYFKKLQDVARQYPIQGRTDDIMRELRGDPDDDYKK